MHSHILINLLCQIPSFRKKTTSRFKTKSRISFINCFLYWWADFNIFIDSPRYW